MEAHLEGGGLSPVLNGKNERKRLAMLGLDYGSGRAVRVPAEAEALLFGLSPSNLQALAAEGQAALDENRALAAIPAFTKVVLLEPNMAEHYLPLGFALRAFKLESQAIAAWETGHELDPTHPDLAFRVADMAHRYGDSARAITLYNQTVKTHPGHGPTWGRLARLRYFEESDDAAWDAIHRAEELGEPIPLVMRSSLAARSPEPKR